MTWPTCTQCLGAYMPLIGVDGCPWCTPDPRIAQREEARLAATRVANQRSEAKRRHKRRLNHDAAQPH